jgi:hypothetical protein
MKTTLADFLPSDHYGHDLFQGGTDAARVMLPKRDDDMVYCQDEKWRVVGTGAGPNDFIEQMFYRRPMSLGNEAGKPPLYRLRGWREPIEAFDQWLIGDCWYAVPAMWLGGTPEKLKNLRAVRCRVSAEEQKPICGQIGANQLPCVMPKGHGGCHVNTDNEGWTGPGDDACLICTTPIYTDSVEIVTVGGHKLHTACFERCASILTEHPKQPPVSGQWVLVKDERPKTDSLGKDIEVITADGYPGISSTQQINAMPAAFFAWFRRYPRPEPPQVPVRGCCERWKTIPWKDAMRWCPYCGVKKP